MDRDWMFTSNDYICGLRTVGVLIRDGKILVQRDKTGTDFALPGGHLKIGEALEDGLAREYKEETGANIKCTRLLWSEECFWKWNGKQAHTISFYYLIDLCEDSAIPDNGEFVSHKDNCNVVLGWMPIEEIKNVTIYPEFLKSKINHLNEPIKHFISRN